ASKTVFIANSQYRARFLRFTLRTKRHSNLFECLTLADRRMRVNGDVFQTCYNTAYNLSFLAALQQNTRSKIFDARTTGS
ncbi:MAG: hypothetical protein ACK40A_14885, partial [Pannonibacter indicus]